MPVRAALQAARQWIEPREQVLSVELPEEPVPVLGDQARLAQVVQNLLHNAAKYTPERGRIALSLRREGAELRLAVRDSGIGMDPATLSTAFELFRQGPQGLQRAQGGLGVGLTLVQRLVHLHGGSVQGHSAGADQGSEFVIRLPAADAPARAAPEPAPLPERTPARRVLIVDDNQDAANALMLLLQNEGHEVKVANDGVSGLALAREYKPDYLLLDIGLPRLSGYDIASTLRADPALRGTIIVAVTGYGQVHDRARTAAMGFDHHLTKPVEFSALQDLFRGKPL